MTIGYIPTEEIIRDRRRSKKSSTNTIIVRKIFDEEHRKKLPIPIFIDFYNHYMNSVNLANQLRATATTHFNRNEKEFFPGMFWSINMILTNFWKIYSKLYVPFLSFTGFRRLEAYREFLETLIKLLFCCNSEIYAENVSGSCFKDYPKYSYKTYKAGPKPWYLDISSIGLSSQSRVTSFTFRDNPEHPSTSIPAKITPILRYQHIKTVIKG
jgi:hypothetical protein